MGDKQLNVSPTVAARRRWLCEWLEDPNDDRESKSEQSLADVCYQGVNSKLLFPKVLLLLRRCDKDPGSSEMESRGESRQQIEVAKDGVYY